jgi:hypothetical protein
MKKYIACLLIFMLTACVAGEFSKERHAQYEQGQPDCNKQPERCINGIPW